MKAVKPFRVAAACAVVLAVGFPAHAEDGADLARQWCAGCHSFPGPELLDRHTWLSGVLPAMGRRLGVQSIPDIPGSIAPPGVHPTESLISEADWARIVAWYDGEAPKALAPAEWPERRALDLFAIEVPARPDDEFPTATAVFIDEAAQKLLVGDSFRLAIQSYGPDLTATGHVAIGAAIARIRRLPSGEVAALAMGETIGPSDAPVGRLVEMPGAGGGATILGGLNRPVDVVSGDFNGDLVTDHVVAEYGAHSGGVTLHVGQAGGGYARVVMAGGAGAIGLVADGDDLLVLMAQGDERLLRIRDFAHASRRAPETVLVFPPSLGLTSIQMLDYDGDGWEDLLVTAGDNADLSPIFKPYHGVYLYRGGAEGRFVEDIFVPFDGAYGATATDFDGDGDLDIAAVSFFPNTNHPLDEASFLFLENTGNGFAPGFVPGLGPLGRFIAIGAGDLDGDGDVDLALVNMAFGPTGASDVPPALQKQWIDGTQVVLLRNQLVRPRAK